MKVQSDSVDITWSKTEKKVIKYQVYYKSKDGQENIVNTDSDQNQITIAGLMPNTKYIFKVKGVFHDQEGQYGPANEDIQTKISLALCLLNSAKLVADGNPAKYEHVAPELQDSRNNEAKTKKHVLGKNKLFLSCIWQTKY